MSSKIEVSRELAERLSLPMERTPEYLFDHRDALDELRAILAAPAVERRSVGHISLKPTPPELAELQATIARLTAEIEQIREAYKGYSSKLVVDALNAEIDRLKGGQGDVQMAAVPVERCYDVRAKMIIAFNESRKNGGDLDDGLDAAYKSALRYSPSSMPAAQPAPVSVNTLSEDLAHDTGYRNGVMHGYKLATEGSEDDYQKCINRLTSEINAGRRESKFASSSVMLPDREWGGPYADGWNACLDKVKELNQ